MSPLSVLEGPPEAETVAKRNQPKPERSGVALHVWIDEPLRKALEACRKKNRRSLKEEVSIALERYAAEQGMWPPPPSK